MKRNYQVCMGHFYYAFMAAALLGFAPPLRAACGPLFGINMSGAEYSWENFPLPIDLDYAKSKSITLIRLPISWEKFQPDLNGPLDANQVLGLKTLIDLAGARGMHVIVDLHNYARYCTTWSQTACWNLWSNGNVASPLTFPSSGTYTFIVQAKGSVAGGVWPAMEFRIDSVKQHSDTVNSDLPVNDTFSLAVAAGTHTLAVAFTNDTTIGSEDRNLYVIKVNITGSLFSAVLAAANMPTKTTGGLAAYRGPGSGQDTALIGSASVPISAYRDFWTKLASEIHYRSGLYGYDIMNEPHNMPTLSVWPTAAQEAINGIRTVDTSTTVYVEGNGWSSGERWVANNPGFPINDPKNKIVYEAHQYFDDGSSNYQQTYDQLGATPTRGADEIQPFLTWLSQHSLKGYVGEFGVPDTDSRWLTVLDNFLSALKTADVEGTEWQYTFLNPGDPSFWHAHAQLGLNPAENTGNSDSPQMAVLRGYAANTCPVTAESPAFRERASVLSFFCQPTLFNSTATIRFSLSDCSPVSLKIYNMLGREVTTLVDEVKPAGEYRVRWNGLDAQGRPLRSGMYYCKLRSNGFTKTKCMVLAK